MLIIIIIPLFWVELVFCEVDLMILDDDAVGFETSLLLIGAAEGKSARELTLRINDLVARV